ncbi:MAG: hypothetical protein K1X89_16310 [Myxococcaceae bacterium]|nr:hypothetical protein [Myxococcaceae bacterium]
MGPDLPELTIDGKPTPLLFGPARITPNGGSSYDVEVPPGASLVFQAAPLDGLEGGSLSIDARLVRGEVATRRQFLMDVPVPLGAKLRLRVTGDRFQLLLPDGSVLEPKVSLSGTAATTEWPLPTVKAHVERGDQVTQVSLSATSKVPGKVTILLSLDGSHFSPYSAPVLLKGKEALTFFARDAYGQNSGMETVTATTTQVFPGIGPTHPSTTEQRDTSKQKAEGRCAETFQTWAARHERPEGLQVTADGRVVLFTADGRLFRIDSAGAVEPRFGSELGCVRFGRADQAGASTLPPRLATQVGGRLLLLAGDLFSTGYTRTTYGATLDSVGQLGPALTLARCQEPAAALRGPIRAMVDDGEGGALLAGSFGGCSDRDGPAAPILRWSEGGGFTRVAAGTRDLDQTDRALELYDLTRWGNRWAGYASSGPVVWTAKWLLDHEATAALRKSHHPYFGSAEGRFFADRAGNLRLVAKNFDLNFQYVAWKPSGAPVAAPQVVDAALLESVQLDGERTLLWVVPHPPETTLSVMALRADGSIDRTYSSQASACLDAKGVLYPLESTGNFTRRRLQVDGSGRAYFLGERKSGTSLVRLAPDGRCDAAYAPL